MKVSFNLFFLAVLVAACSSGGNVDVKSFRTGTFEIPAGQGFDKTKFVRTDSLQIEYYQNRTDSLKIVWKDNFNYTLYMLQPKSKLDKEPIRVRITSVKANSYEFEAIIGHSNFKQKGTVNKIED
ncbi:hypothetical protein [Urechidicola vernalis]|uniref:DNA topoisomerase IV n=1 Tax=Urechidicola vernalis TaxID=3075600 RepID=A0ABU2Y0R7_9FLAO|nr:hypothetical protein [Urechidicola sp. P050]MDT0551701.1 hypothetical protein [Urechidicola sp. P050]